MLRHTGSKRSFQHNMRLAVLLCFDAGFVNAAGFLGFNVLTTNVRAMLPYWLWIFHHSNGEQHEWCLCGYFYSWPELLPPVFIFLKWEGTKRLPILYLSSLLF